MTDLTAVQPIRLTVSGARGKSFADIARATGSIGGQPVAPTDSDQQVIDKQVSAATARADAAAASAATAEAAAGPTYASTAAGLAATTDGEAFAVDNGDGTVTVYLNDGGTAVEQRTLATTDYLASDAGAATLGTADGTTVQANLDATSLVSGDLTAFNAKVAAVRAAADAGRVILKPNGYSPASAMTVTGEFTGGLHLDGANSLITPAADGIDGQYVGNVVGSIAAEYYNKFRFENFSLLGQSKTGGATGLNVHAAADMAFTNYRINNFQYGIQLNGGLSNSFFNTTLYKNGTGLYGIAHVSEPGGPGGLGPNANSFYGCHWWQNDKAINYDSTSNTAINFFGGNIEANNYTAGTNTDGVKVSNFTTAGHINMFGIHSESNKGQYGYYYSGNDSTKVFLAVGNEIIDSVGTNVYIDKGTLCSVASRIYNSGATANVSLNTGAYATLIDSDTVPSGDLSHVVSIRFGRLTFGANSASGNAPIYITPAAISSVAGNVAMTLRNDTVQIQFQNTAGTRTGYIQTSSASDHALNNSNAAGGWVIQSANVSRLWVGRAGAASVEPGSDNTTTLGSATFRFSTVYAATGTINTSDARTKQQVRELSDAEHAVAVRCKGLLRAFKFNDAVEEKGDKARIHFGVIAQDVMSAFEAEGLDATDYALLCHDTWEDQTETWDDQYEDVPAVYSDTETDAAGAPIEITPATRKLVKEAGSRVIMEAGDRYGIRYEELLAFMIAAL